MKWQRKFWKLRRESDMVKVMLLLLTAGVGFLIYIIYNGMTLYQQLHSPVEYVIGGAGELLTDSGIDDISELKNVIAVTQQQAAPVTIKYQSKEILFSCTELSEKYIESVYGLRESGATKIFYMNQKAYKQLVQDIEGKESSLQDGLQINYVWEEQTDDGEARQRERTAKVVLMKDNWINDEPYVFCKKDNQSIRNHDDVKVRAYVRQQDLDGGNIAQLQGLGFSIEDEGKLQKEEYLHEIMILKMEYGAMMMLTLFGCTLALWKFWKKSERLKKERIK